MKDKKYVLSRRSFLINSGATLGGCLIPRDLYRQLWRWHEYDGNREILLPERSLPSPRHTLNVYEDENGYRITLGPRAESLEDVDIPTWRIYLSRQGLNTESEIVKTWLIEAEGYEPQEAKKVYRQIHLDQPLDGEYLWNYIDNDFPLRDSPEAKAFHYLQDLALANRPADKTDDCLGELKFMEGGCIGSNFTAAYADSEMLLSASSIDFWNWGGCSDRVWGKYLVIPA